MFGAVLAAAMLLAPDSGRLEAARADLERVIGMRLDLRGSVEVRLLPWPAVVAHDVAISGNGVALQAATVQGKLAFSDLLRGRTGLAALLLSDVTGSVELDALAARRRLGAPAGAAAPDLPRADGTAGSGMLPASLTLAGGLVQVKSSHAALDGFVGDLHATLNGLRGGSSAFSGQASWHGERADVSARFDSLTNFLRGQPASGSIRLQSEVATVALVGGWDEGWMGGFKGSVTASTSTLAGLMRLAGIAPGAFAGVGRVSFSGTTEPTGNGLAFDDAHIVVNDDSLEGTIGLQKLGDQWTLSGTLASDNLDVTPFAAILPDLREAGGGWSTAPIPLSPRDLHDIDLRLSVGKLQMNRLSAADVGLSLLCRDGRMELSIGEAQAYGGLVKARLFTTGDPTDLAVKGDVSWAQIDVAKFYRAVGNGPGPWAGSASGSINAEGRGQSAREIVRHLEGKGQASWHQGRAAASPVLDLLLRDAPVPGVASRPLEFDLASATFNIVDGVATIGTSAISGPDMHVEFQGHTSLPDQDYVLSALSPVAEQVASAGESVPPRPRGVRGSWHGSPHLFEPEWAPRLLPEAEVRTLRPTP